MICYSLLIFFQYPLIYLQSLKNGILGNFKTKINRSYIIIVKYLRKSKTAPYASMIFDVFGVCFLLFLPVGIFGVVCLEEINPVEFIVGDDVTKHDIETLDKPHFFVICQVTQIGSISFTT